jgi:general secretion pathway protein D
MTCHLRVPRPHSSRWLGLSILLLAASVWAGSMTLKFEDADIGEVIRAISAVTGKSFIVDPRVKGKVTIVSSRPLDEDTIYQVFLSVLEVHGFAAIPGEGFVKIVPDATAKQGAIPTVTAGDRELGDQLVTQVVPVQHVAAAQLVPILRPLVAQQGHLAAYPASNVLIVADRAANIERILKIVERIDRPTEGDVELVQLRHASAAEVVRMLSSLTQGAGKDVPGGKPVLIADERTNSVLIGGARESRLRLRTIITHLDTPTDSGGNTRVIYLRYAKAADLAGVLSSLNNLPGTAPKGAAAQPGSEVNIQADESTNALVITAPPEQMRALRDVIRKLDIRRAQVLIESIIAEMVVGRSAQLGVEWVVDAHKDGGAVGVVNFGSFNLTPDVIDNPISGLSPSALGTGLSLGMGSFSGDIRFAAIIKALAGDSSTNILSMPNLVTMDNEQAEIVVGKNVPFITGSFTTSVDTGSTGTNPFQTIERQDVGLTLRVKPQINEGDAVKLEIEQEVSSIAASTILASDLITNKRLIKTVVLVDDGGIVVLGGLMEDNVRETKQKVPVLGNLPLIGGLFRSQSSDLDKTTLLIFIHPTIMRTADDNLRIAGDKYNFVRTRQMEQRLLGVDLMSAAQKPALPPLNDYLALPPPFEEVHELTEPPVDVREKAPKP